MWGARVKNPCDMPDDVMRDAIMTVGKELDEMAKVQGATIEEYGPGICERVKQHFDKKWSPHWHVIIGTNFGCFCTHEMRMYIYFYYGTQARVASRHRTCKRQLKETGLRAASQAARLPSAWRVRPFVVARSETVRAVTMNERALESGGRNSGMTCLVSCRALRPIAETHRRS